MNGSAFGFMNASYEHDNEKKSGKIGGGARGVASEERLGWRVRVYEGLAGSRRYPLPRTLQIHSLGAPVCSSFCLILWIWCLILSIKWVYLLFSWG